MELTAPQSLKRGSDDEFKSSDNHSSSDIENPPPVDPSDTSTSYLVPSDPNHLTSSRYEETYCCCRKKIARLVSSLFIASSLYPLTSSIICLSKRDLSQYCQLAGGVFGGFCGTTTMGLGLYILLDTMGIDNFNVKKLGGYLFATIVLSSTPIITGTYYDVTIAHAMNTTNY